MADDLEDYDTTEIELDYIKEVLLLWEGTSLPIGVETRTDIDWLIDIMRVQLGI